MANLIFCEQKLYKFNDEKLFYNPRIQVGVVL
jgi:hypothetical protein